MRVSRDWSLLRRTERLHHDWRWRALPRAGLVLHGGLQGTRRVDRRDRDTRSCGRLEHSEALHAGHDPPQGHCAGQHALILITFTQLLAARDRNRSIKKIRISEVQFIATCPSFGGAARGARAQRAAVLKLAQSRLDRRTSQADRFPKLQCSQVLQQEWP